MVSWRNPQATDTDGIDGATWGDYIEHAIYPAIDIAHEITGKPINAVGFCVGGTMLASALALAAESRRARVHSLTLLTTMLDFADTGVLDVFVDE